MVVIVGKGKTTTTRESSAPVAWDTVALDEGDSIPELEGYDVLIKALAVCIIGGLGSTGGVIAASIIVGFAERFTDTYIGSHWTMIVSLAAILIVLTIKPSGLFGKQKELEERI